MRKRNKSPERRLYASKTDTHDSSSGGNAAFYYARPLRLQETEDRQKQLQEGADVVPFPEVFAVQKKTRTGFMQTLGVEVDISDG
uniref:Transposase n=1 Tax=Steinernema glaseri TaxID=37863 RepID=A0A1I7Z039_9BILA